MSEARDDPSIFWVDPRNRGILPLDNFHVSRSLAKVLRQDAFSATLDADFEAVLHCCANRSETWINQTIYDLYLRLHEMGVAHSIEVWRDKVLAGGVYGVVLGGAFFGESMFSNRTNGSKVALFHTVEWLKQQGFTLFDTQFTTPHLRSLGGIEIPRSDYHERLQAALKQNTTFGPIRPLPASSQLWQLRTQTS